MAEQLTCWGTALPPSTVDMSRRMGTPSPLPPNSLKYHRKQSSCGQTSLSCQQAIGFVKKKSSQARQTLSAFFLQRQLRQPFFSCSGCARVAQALKNLNNSAMVAAGILIKVAGRPDGQGSRSHTARTKERQLNSSR